MRRKFRVRTATTVVLASFIAFSTAVSAGSQLADHPDPGPVGSTMLPFGAKAPIPPDALEPQTAAPRSVATSSSVQPLTLTQLPAPITAHIAAFAPPRPILASIRAAEGQPTADQAPEYVTLTRGAQRLDIHFQFQPNAWALDDRGLRDITRLAEYLATEKVSPNHVLLIGFGDNLGTPSVIRDMSEGRAWAVAEALRRLGVVVGKTVGLGAVMPVADNGSEDGRSKNRRVEVYVLP